MGKASARIGDDHVCPRVGHVGGPIITSGAPTVVIVGQQAGTVTSACKCRGGANDKVVQGSATVLLSGHSAARIGDRTEHGGKIVTGAASVVIGG